MSSNWDCKICLILILRRNCWKGLVSISSLVLCVIFNVQYFAKNHNIYQYQKPWSRSGPPWNLGLDHYIMLVPLQQQLKLNQQNFRISELYQLEVSLSCQLMEDILSLYPWTISDQNKYHSHCLLRKVLYGLATVTASLSLYNWSLNFCFFCKE